MSVIENVYARQIFDSRGHPTVEVEVTLASGATGRAGVPAGASTGSREAKELRDGGTAYGGQGVGRAVANVNGEVAAALLEHDAIEQEAIDRLLILLDGTLDKSRLGANAVLGVSLAVARAMAVEEHVSLWRYWAGRDPGRLPVPMLNVINGGAHADNRLDFQEFMLVPVGARSFSEAMLLATETYQQLKGILRDRGLGATVGDEGGFAPDLETNEDALVLLVEGIEAAGYVPGTDIALALDPATSELYRDGRYELRGEGRTLTSGALVDYWCDLADRYPIVALEDGMAQDDWAGWRELTRQLGDRIQLVGDDVFVTNPTILERAIDEGVANSILIKPNQIGTLTETFETIELAQGARYRTVVSHRSGETEDSSIADLAVGRSCDQIKAGAPARGERLAKYNQLLRIEEELGQTLTDPPTRARRRG